MANLSISDNTLRWFPARTAFSRGILLRLLVVAGWPGAAWEVSPVSPGRLLSSALGDDLPRRIDDNAAIFTAARNSPERCLLCGNLVGIVGPPGILVIPPSAKG